MKKQLQKFITLCVCAFILIASLASCSIEKSYEGAPDGMRPICEGENGAILYVPKAWSVDTSTGIPTAYVGSKNSSMITLVTVPAEKVPGGEITKYFDSYREDFQKNIKDFKIIKVSDDAKDYQTRMIAGASAYVYEFSGKITNIDYNFRQAYLLHPETKDLFIITCSAVPEAYNSLGKTITEVYDNFTFVTEPIKMEDKTEIKLPGTEGVEVPSGFTLISNEFVDYYFFVPSDWTPTVNTGMSAAVSNKSSRTGASVVAFNTRYLSLDDYWTGYEEELKATFGEITYLSDAKYSASKVGGLDARAYSYKITQNGTEYVYTQNVLIYNGYVYIITFSCENGSFDAFSLDFDGILQSFKFKN